MLLQLRANRSLYVCSEADGIAETIPALLADGGDGRSVDVLVGLEVLEHLAHPNGSRVVLCRVGDAAATHDVVDNLRECAVSIVILVS